MEETAKYVLTFTTSFGARDKYTIPRANKNLTENELLVLMNDIIDNGFISTAKGYPRVPESAELIECTYTEII